MDISKHNITIPLKDYNDLVAAKNTADSITANVQAHIDMMRQGGISIGYLNVGKKPTKVFVSGGTMRGAHDAADVKFEY